MDSRVARTWCEAAGGSAANAGDRWDAHAKTDVPVITVFGSYDTGKSSLVRRLLLEAGEQVPDWLTVSARHETFEAREINAGRVRLRDTPGIAVGAEDLRGRANTASAIAALEPTDVLLITVTSQLATGEYDLLRDLVNRGWVAGSLRFVITRFDEAGADPDTDPVGYAELARAKITELRESLDLDLGVPVYVIAQDPFQIGGGDPDVDPSIYQDSRAWDGMVELCTAMDGVADDFGALRVAAEDRLWTATIRGVADELDEALPELVAAAAQARSVAATTEEWRELLAELDSSARAALNAIIDDVVVAGATLGSTAREHLAADLNRALDDWLRRQGNELDHLMQDIGSAARRERARPQWQALNAIVESARESAVNAANTRMESEQSDISEKVETLAPLIAAAMASGIDTLGPANTTIGRVDLHKVQAVVNGGLSFAQFIAPEIDERINDARRRAFVAAATRSRLDGARAEVFAAAVPEWEVLKLRADAVIEELSGRQGTIVDECETAVERARRMRAEAEELLAGA